MSRHFPTKKEVVRFYGIISQVANYVVSNIWMGAVNYSCFRILHDVFGLGEEGVSSKLSLLPQTCILTQPNINLKLQSPE